MTNDQRFTYKEAGVDVEAGNRAVELMKERLTSARHPLVLGGLGGFGGAMQLPPLTDPVLVAGADGVGTKIELARAVGRLTTIGIDLVAMSVNDVSACGATPLFFLDYLVVGKVVPEQVAEIVGGVDEGCRLAGCALLGGETAEHPGQFTGGDFDLAGFAVGTAERDALWGPQRVRDGDALIGIRSSGLHSNGFSLVRHLLKAHHVDLASELPGAEGVTVGDALLEPTTIYSPALAALGSAVAVHAAAHITGGGYPDNVGRAVPTELAAVVDLDAWVPGPLFSWLHSLGVSEGELLRTFNCGLGMVVALPRDDAPRAIEIVTEHGLEASLVGEVVPRVGDEAVVYRGALAL